MTERAPVVLHFQDSGEWFSLPEWAEYFISIGEQLAHESQTESRLVTAIVLPTRAFAAAFVSLGMVISDAAARDQASESTHFEALFDMPVGTRVILRLGNGKALKGLLRAPEERDGNIWLPVQVHSDDGGALTYQIDEAHALQVQPTGGRNWKLPKKQGRENVRTANKFVDSLVGEADAVQLGLRSKLVCALVGRRSSLEQEIRRTPLSILVNGARHAEGQLQDVLRVDKFVTPQQSHRSALVAVGGDSPTSNVVSNVETGVVFDGAAGFLKWGSVWRSRHQVIILDRTETYFDDAVSAINARLSQDGIHDGCVIPDGDPPAGGEIIAFREAIQ